VALDGKIKVRLVLFVLALMFAVGSFTYGVVSLGHRDSGWYEVDATAEAKAVTYGSGVHLLYYAAGGSNAIRQTISAVQKAYSDSLARYVKMLDARNVYDDVTSVAAVSAAGGDAVVIGRELFEVLSDALAKTEEDRGYSLFAGALWREWETLLYLDEPQPFDPANSADEAARIGALAEITARRALFELTLSEADGGTAAFSTGAAYRAFEAEQEIDAPALDLNAMHDAYLIELVARAMTRLGLTDGYLYTDSGLTVLLDAERAYPFDLYGCGGGESVRAGTLKADGLSAFCQYTAFPPAGERYGFYAVETERGVRLRHPRFDARTGAFHDVLLSVALASGTKDIVELAWQGLALNMLDSREEIDALLAADGEELAAVYALQAGNSRALHANAQGAARIEPDEANGYRLE